MSTASHLRIEGMTKLYGATAAVEDVNLDVAQARCWSCSPSGCGKTTTLRLVAGFVAATRGRILVEGKDYAALPPYQREMGMVFHSYALFPHLTVAQNVTFGLRMRKLPKAEIDTRLEQTLRHGQADDDGRPLPPPALGGQQQRVAWHAHSPSAPRCCCSTSRSPISTPICASPLPARSASSSARRA